MKMKKPKTTIEIINPEIAKEYLASNMLHQRHVTATHLTHLRQQMQNGQWKMTGEPIIFDEHGMLVDGQHRLRALIAANMTFEFVVTRGVSDDAFIAMNRGKSRSHSDILSIHGVKNYTTHASCINGVLNYRRALLANEGKGGSLNTNTRPSSQDVLDEYNENPSEYDAAVTIALRCKKTMSPSIVATCAALAIIDGTKSVDTITAFWDGVVTGVNLYDGHPALTLRNLISQNNTRTAKIPKSHLMWYSIKAWNAYAMKRSLKLLKIVAGETIPKVV